jgi:hypothetical protein
MIGSVKAKKSPRGRGAGGQCCRGRLQRGTSALVLQSHRWQISAKGAGEVTGIAVPGTHQLPEIGGKPDGSFYAAVRDPGMPVVLLQILPCHQHITAARVSSDVMVEVLTGIRLVAQEEARLTETEVLNEDTVAAQHLLTFIADFDMPQPQVLPGMQPQRDPIAYPAYFALPDAAIRCHADPTVRLSTRKRQDQRLAAADAQTDTTHAAGNRRAERLVDHDAATSPQVLDGEDRAVRQQADHQPGPIAQLLESEIAHAGQCQALRRFFPLSDKILSIAPSSRRRSSRKRAGILAKAQVKCCRLCFPAGVNFRS